MTDTFICRCIVNAIPDGSSRMPDPDCPAHPPAPERPCPRCAGQVAWVGGRPGLGTGVECRSCGWLSPKALGGPKEDRVATAVKTWPEIAAGREDAYANRPLRGVSHLLALAIYVLDLDMVHRSTVRSLLPAGERSLGGGRNKVTTKVQWALRCFQACRWVWLLQDEDGSELIWVKDRDALLGWVLGAVDPQPEISYQLLQVGRAAQELAAQMDADPDEVRRSELLALKRLMERGPGTGCFERGHVRIVPRASVL